MDKAQRARYEAWKRMKNWNVPKGVRVYVDIAKPGSDKTGITVIDEGNLHTVAIEDDVQRVFYKGQEIFNRGKA